MSLFNSREWWSTRLGTDEEFDQGSICVANIDNDPNGADKIITGSLQGVLRVHQPHQRGYRIEDILLETELEGSILQLAAGSFMGGSELCLAVLHPRKLAVYSVAAEGSSYLALAKIYEHHLEHTAANMTTGRFGGAAGFEAIAVQSYDGQLSFFEQEAAAFSRFLPGFLLPGPLAYLPASDSFVTSTAALELVAYRYSSLAAASGDKEAEPAAGQGKQGPAAAAAAAGGGGGGGKRLQADWRVVLGEAALDIKAGRVAPGSRPDGPQDILVLGEHTIFILGPRGQLLAQRRLDYHPACCWAFPAGSSSSGSGNGSSSPPENLLIATHTKALLVYRGGQLAWAARLELLPVAVRVAELGGLGGLVVALDDAGRLSVCYLGSEPPKQSVSFADARPADYAAMEAERQSLLATIRAAGAAGMDAAAAAKAGAAAGAAAADARVPGLSLRAQVPSRLDAPDRVIGEDGLRAAAGGGATDGVKQLTVTLLLHNTTGAALQDVAISVLVPAPVVALQPQLTVAHVQPSSKAAAAAAAAAGAAGAAAGQQPLAVEVVLQAPSSCSGSSGIPASNTAQVVATFRQPGQQQLCASQLSVQLPMCLFCQVIPPVKNAEYKITLATNREPAQLVALFGDMLVQANPAHAEALSRSQGANVMTFAFSSGQDISILVSKAGGRYRLQSDCFQALWLAAQELARRLAAHFAAAEGKPGAAKAAAAGPAGAAGGTGAGAASITFDESLPLQDVLELVKAHFDARLQLAAAEAQLEQLELQFRSIQKRLLARYKDKNAGPLNQLDVLMEETHDQIITLATQVEEAQGRLAEAGQALGAGVQLLLLLVKHRFGLSAEELAVLQACLSPVVVEGAEVSWEEVTDAALTQLLRTSLARSAKDAAAGVPPLAAATDTERLAKHVSLVLERLSKGMRLVPQGQQQPQQTGQQHRHQKLS